MNEEIGSALLPNYQLSKWIKPILLIASMRWTGYGIKL